MVLNFTFLKQVFRGLFLLTFFSLCRTGNLTAQVKFTTVVSPEKAGLSDYIEVDYIIENARTIENFSAPVFKGLELLQGPSQSTNMTVINGAVSRSQTLTYILQPQATGKFTIPGAMAIIDGKTMRSNPVTVEITDRPGNRARPTPQRRSVAPLFPDLPEFRPNIGDDYKLRPGENPAEKIAKNLFVKLNISKTTCYAGEPILATYKLYSRLSSETQLSKNPTLNGFSVFDMNQSSREVTREEINGQEYNVQIIRKVQLLPLQAGSYTVDPVELESRIDLVRVPENSSYQRPRSSNPMQRIIDEFFGRAEEEGEVEHHTVTLKSDPVVITVLPLPGNKPANFTGAVGKFTLAASLKKNDLKAGDVGELDITIQGKGNIPMISTPPLHLPGNMESFEPSVKDEVNNSAFPLSGSKKISYTFLVNKEGDYTVPPVSFSYFDPAAKAYKTLESDTFSLHVAPNGALAVKPEPGQTDPALLTPSSKWTDVIGLEIIVGAIMILVLLGVIIYLLKRNQVTDPGVPKETIQASTSAEAIPEETSPVDPLQGARTALVEGNNEAFYSEISKAMREVVEQKTGAAAAILTKTNMAFMLKEQGVPDETVSALESLINKCEMALYTPVQQERDKVALLEKAEGIINNIKKPSREAVIGL